MKRFDHPNIVGLLGVCFDTPDGYPYLILPYMVNGNVRDYLKDKRIHHTLTSALPDVSVMKANQFCIFPRLCIYIGFYHKDPSRYVC